MTQTQTQIQTTSAQAIIAVLGKLSRTRKTRVFFQRKVVHDLMASLYPAWQDAMVEIALAPGFDENPGFYRTMRYAYVSSMRLEDLNDYQLRIRKTYHEWRAQLYRDSPVALTIATRICHYEDSVNAIAKSEHIHHTTVIRLLHYALNEYAILAGWGDQMAKP